MRDIPRDLDGKFAAYREALDLEIARSGAVPRLKRSLARHTTGPLAGMDWRRLAAGVLIAGALGGALDLILPDTTADQTEVAILDPLDLDGAE